MSDQMIRRLHPEHTVHPSEVAPFEERLPALPKPHRFPLHISPDRRRLLDADGLPFLVQGDAAWSIIANLPLEDAVRYLDDRRAKGFNTVLVNLIEHLFSHDPPRDLAGREPFTTPGDMSTPNDAYFDAAERVLEACTERGFLVVLAPTYIGYRHERGGGVSSHMDGWYDEIVATGPDGCRRYGEYLGRRFGRFANIMWCIGGDWHPDASRPGLDATAAGIRSAGVKTLFTAHVHPETSPLEAFAGSDWLDVNVTYTYGIVHQEMIKDWRRDPAWPFFLVESTYEGEHNASELQIRRQAWWSVLCGANGHIMGNHPIWLFWTGWQAALDLPGSVAMARWGGFFRSLRWADLRPDVDRRILTGGLGESRGLDRATAAVSADGSTAVIYTPARRPLEVQLSGMTGPRLSIEWFEPATGHRMSGGLVATEGTAWFTPPFAEDAVLVLTTAA
jgi:uncharacterized protein DUF4038/collagenase-like protein with putative collagen-binding domain